MWLLTLLATNALAPPPPPPYFGCPQTSACLRVALPPSQAGDDANSAGCSEAIRRTAVLPYVSDYEPSGVDSVGRTHFRSRHHANVFLYFTEPAAEFSPAMHSEWVFSKQRSNELVIGDARAISP